MEEYYSPEIHNVGGGDISSYGKVVTESEIAVYVAVAAAATFVVAANMAYVVEVYQFGRNPRDVYKSNVDNSDKNS